MDEFKRVIKNIIKTNIKPGDLNQKDIGEGHMPISDLFMAGSEEEEENGGEEEEVTNITINVDEVMGIDRKGKKKPESKSNMTKVSEAVAEEESVADYIIDYYRNPNKPKESMVDEKIVGEYFKNTPRLGFNMG